MQTQWWQINHVCLNFFSSIDGMTNSQYMFISCIGLHCAYRCSGAKNAGLCADPVMTNKPCLLDIFSSIDGITNSKYIYISYIVLHCSCRCSDAINVGLCAEQVITNKPCLLDIFIRPFEKRTYYAMAMSVRLSVRPSEVSGLFFNILWDIDLKLDICIK